MKLRPAAPQLPAAAPVIPGILIEGRCVACQHRSVATHVEVIDGERMRICTNALTCTNRYRDGATPAAYALTLIGA